MFFELVFFCIFQFYVDIVNGFDKKIFVGFFFFQVNLGDIKELFFLGSKQQDLIIVRLDDDRLMLGRDEFFILIDFDGNLIQRYFISWFDLFI